MKPKFNAVRAEPYDYTIEAGHWAWFEDVKGTEFDSEEERWATLPAKLFAALDRHDEYDPSLESMKRYPTREAAIDALKRALLDR
jgi:hypothetical protein